MRCTGSAHGAGAHPLGRQTTECSDVTRLAPLPLLAIAVVCGDPLGRSASLHAPLGAATSCRLPGYCTMQQAMARGPQEMLRGRWAAGVHMRQQCSPRTQPHSAKRPQATPHNPTHQPTCPAANAEVPPQVRDSLMSPLVTPGCQASPSPTTGTVPTATQLQQAQLPPNPRMPTHRPSTGGCPVPCHASCVP